MIRLVTAKWIVQVVFIIVSEPRWILHSTHSDYNILINKEKNELTSYILVVNTNILLHYTYFVFHNYALIYGQI